MPNERLGNDRQIRYRSLFIESLLHGAICTTKCQSLLNSVSFIPSFFFFLSSGHLLVNNCSIVTAKMAIRLSRALKYQSRLLVVVLPHKTTMFSVTPPHIFISIFQEHYRLLYHNLSVHVPYHIHITKINCSFSHQTL